MLTKSNPHAKLETMVGLGVLFGIAFIVAFATTMGVMVTRYPSGDKVSES